VCHLLGAAHERQRCWAAVCSDTNRNWIERGVPDGGQHVLGGARTLEVPSQYPQSPRDLLSPDEAVLPVRPLSIHLRRVGPGLKKGMHCNDREA
jgi:hypothetical protein